MGCASSTPMVATAGSEFLKTASHVAGDATKTAEGAAHEVADAVGKSLDTAKEAMGTKVTGLANELTHAFNDKTDQLEEAKQHLIDKLQPHHSGEPHDGDKHKKMHHEAMTTINEHSSRPPTPSALHHADADSLKTSTPEPEIEQALANCIDDDSPPTPKPTLSELEQLSAELGDDMPAAGKNGHSKEHPHASAITAIVAADNSATANVDKMLLSEQKRPGTTEWEKYADMLAKSRKYIPNDGYRRAGRFVPQTQPYHQAHNFKSKGAVATPRIRRQDSWLSEHHTNSHNSPLHSQHTSPKGFTRKALPHTLTPANARHFQREFASLVNNDKPVNVKLPRKVPPVGRKFDFNTQRSRVHLPSHATATHSTPGMTAARSLSRIHSPVHRDSVTHWSAMRSNAHSKHIDETATPHSQHNGIRSYSHTNSPLHSRGIATHSTVVSPIKSAYIPSNTSSASHSSSSSDGVVIKTGPISSNSSSPVKLHMMSDFSSARLGARTPILNIDTKTATTTLPSHKMLKPISGKQSHAGSRATSPHRSPYSSRHSLVDISEKENKFNTDLSSVTERRSTLAASPYKIRERCAVCYNKYLVK